MIGGEVIVHFVDIDGTVDHRGLNFLFIILSVPLNIGHYDMIKRVCCSKFQ
jgi:hypothetical protein